MSAWTVSKGHIDILVNALVKAGLSGNVTGSLRQEVADEIGRRLWRENVRSVNYRYNERKRTPEYVAELTDAELRPEDVLAAIHCYQYQACERPDWDKSWAYRAMAALEGLYRTTYPEALTNLDRGQKYGPDRVARWGYESLAQAIVGEGRDDTVEA